MRVDACNAASYEWKNGELFVIPEVFSSGGMAYLSPDVVEAIRANKPEDVPDSFPMFAVKRSESGDKIYKVVETVVFAGGSMQCYIRPIGSKQPEENS